MNVSGKTPVSALQELMASKGLPLPTYHEALDSALLQFKCTVNAGGVTAVGFGPNKKAAKQESAKNALMRLNQKLPGVTFIKPLKNYVGDLNEYSSKNGASYPVYDLIPGTPGGYYIYNCYFLGNHALGRGANKKEAKQNAARNMLILIQTNSFVINKRKVAHSKTTLEVEDIDQIIAMYDTLMASTSTAQAETVTPKNNNVDYLKEKLTNFGIEYSINEIQTSPCYILSLSVKGSIHNFLETGDTKDQALEKAFNKILLMKETGNLFNDLITL